MRGTSGDTFQPTKTLTRAESVQILYALAGKPAVFGQTPFHDVASGAWYQQAVTWAYQTRITSGVLPNEFRPNDPISREQLVVMLYRYSGSPAVSDALHKKHYADAKQVSDWAQPAMNWAIANGVITGIPSGHKVLLSPHTNSTREQVATIIAKTFC
ncbi:MAG: S-layer homology domain-containing protein [Eubacteriales bacterium]|nr:S-layer homology domain-containing protein [Eubacteriales bacterium]